MDRTRFDRRYAALTVRQAYEMARSACGGVERSSATLTGASSDSGASASPFNGEQQPLAADPWLCEMVVTKQYVLTGAMIVAF